MEKPRIITAANFITDDKTNKVFVSSWIDKPTGNLDLTEDDKHLLKDEILKTGQFCGLLYNTTDIWARDYMPIQLTDDLFLSYTYKPDYLNKYPTSVTNWQLHGVSTKDNNKTKVPFEGTVVQMPVILDGGNVIKAVCKGQPCMVMCNKVLKENNVSEATFRMWWNEWWKNNFMGTKMGLVLLPWEGMEKNPIGHADGMVRYIGEGRVLMANYYGLDPTNNDRDGEEIYKSLAKSFGEENVVRLDFRKFKKEHQAEKLCRDLYPSSWCYINYLHVNGTVLVPQLGYPELDKEACAQINEAFSQVKDRSCVRLICVDMTHVVAEMNDFFNSGGALNCLTWTILSKQDIADRALPDGWSG